ncbi:MAG: response regulator transcription factor [Acidimicrobiales bacterium]
MRLLVAEDNVRMASLIQRGLQEEGHAVDVVGDGPDAVWMATENPYAAIILDVMLPGCDGYEVARRIREHGQWAPVLMLTARTDVRDRVQGLDAGADDYLTKPFNFAELSARLRALLRRGQPERPTVLEVGNLRLDPATRRVSRAGTRIDLTPKEFALLDLLMRSPGAVVTRTQIIEHVWDFAFDGVSNIVDQYVSYLRRKVDQPFGCQDIETIRGVGYRLRDPGCP